MSQPQVDLLLDLVLDLKKEQGEIKQLTLENSVVLKEHMRRTEVAEKRLDLVENNVMFVTSLGKLIAWTIGIVGGIVGIVYSIIQILR